MNSSRSSSPQTILMESMRNFLDQQVLDREEEKVCSRCGSVMQYMDGKFWIYGTDWEWDLRVPVCTCLSETSLEPPVNKPGRQEHRVNEEVSVLPVAAAWRDLYRSALFERDRNKLLVRLADAETAVVLRTRELFHAQGKDLSERQSLDAAMCALQALRGFAESSRKGSRMPAKDARSRIA